MTDPRFVAVEPSVRAFESACGRLVAMLARQYLSSEERAMLDDTRPIEQDHLVVAATVRRLEAATPFLGPPADQLDAAVAHAARTRVFREAMQRLAGH